MSNDGNQTKPLIGHEKPLPQRNRCRDRAEPVFAPSCRPSTLPCRITPAFMLPDRQYIVSMSAASISKQGPFESFRPESKDGRCAWLASLHLRRLSPHRNEARILECNPVTSSGPVNLAGGANMSLWKLPSWNIPGICTRRRKKTAPEYYALMPAPEPARYHVT